MKKERRPEARVRPQLFPPQTPAGAARGGCAGHLRPEAGLEGWVPKEPQNSTCGTAPAAPELRTEGGQGRAPPRGPHQVARRGGWGAGTQDPALGLPRLLAETPWVHNPRAPWQVPYLGVERPGDGSRGRLPTETSRPQAGPGPRPGASGAPGARLWAQRWGGAGPARPRSQEGTTWPPDPRYLRPWRAPGQLSGSGPEPEARRRLPPRPRAPALETRGSGPGLSWTPKPAAAPTPAPAQASLVKAQRAPPFRPGAHKRTNRSRLRL